jgi:predicted AlkP superfamily pyrophosphatase or phosphodiesterase
MPGLLEKYDHLFTGGYRWLKDNGIQFSEAYHEHGYTVTGPGHFVLSTGQYPGTGGVIGNYWFDRETNQGWYCVKDTTSTVLKDGSMGLSYQNIEADALGDWMKEANLESKVVSVAGKDRASILLGGKKPDAALWYDRAGGWTSSTYYHSSLPRWVQNFNSQLNIASFVDSTWQRLASEDIYTSNTRADNFYGETDWTMSKGYSPTFPIDFKERGAESIISSYHYVPFGDNTVLRLGLTAVNEYHMGKDEIPDILFLGLSAADGVGHSFGPHSHEQLDNYLRLDKNLGAFIQKLESEVGSGKVLYVLSSDHGALGLPEYLQSQGIDSGRIPKPKRDSLFTLVTNEIDKQIGPGKVTRYGNFFYYNNSINPMEREVATEILKSHLSKLEGIHTVITKEDMLKGGNSVFKMRLKNMVHPEKSPDVYLITKKYWTWKYPVGASHGSPYDYDAHVPLIFARGGQKAIVKSVRVKTVDIAPTVARILKIDFPKSIDGEALSIE